MRDHWRSSKSMSFSSKNITETKYKRIKSYEIHSGDIAKQHILEVLDSDYLANGKKVQAFEKGWNSLFQYKHSVFMCLETDALVNMCLSLYDTQNAIRGKSEVIVPALSSIRTANAVRAAGLIPVFVDVEASTLNINPRLIEQDINKNTVAIMPVHMMGRMADMTIIQYLGYRYDIAILEDACEAYGATLNGYYPGHYSHLVAFGFHGGIISTEDGKLDNILRSIYTDQIRADTNSQMDDIGASISLECLVLFKDDFQCRHDIMTTIYTALSEYQDIAWFSLEDEERTNCPCGISVTMKNEKHISFIIQSLDKYNIEWCCSLSIPTQCGIFADMKYKLGQFPEAEWIGNNGIRIGCHQYLSDNDVNRICEAFIEGFKQCV